MKATRQLHQLGQSLWLDNITRTLLDDGTLARYIAEDSITGLTSNPSIFDAAIGDGDAYDAGVHAKTLAGLSGEGLFIELALEDLRRAADLFKPVFDATGQVDGWVSMEVSPLLAADTAGSIAAARHIHHKAQRDNLFVKIPGTPEGVPAIEEAIFLGIPINVTLLFSCAHYQAVAEAYMRGIERRLAAGLDPKVGSVASLFISRWDRAVHDLVPPDLRNQLGIAVAGVTYANYRELLDSDRWQRLAKQGAMPQRLLWASRPIGPIASCWPRHAGRSWLPPARCRSACCGPAPAPRTRTRLTRCISARSPHRTPSTRCRRRPCTPSPTTASCTA